MLFIHRLSVLDVWPSGRFRTLMMGGGGGIWKLLRNFPDGHPLIFENVWKKKNIYIYMYTLYVYVIYIYIYVQVYRFYVHTKIYIYIVYTHTLKSLINPMICLAISQLK